MFPLYCVHCSATPFKYACKNEMENKLYGNQRNIFVGLNAGISTKYMHKMWWSFLFTSFVSHAIGFVSSQSYFLRHSIHLIHFIRLFSIFAALVMLSPHQGHLICLVQPVYINSHSLTHSLLRSLLMLSYTQKSIGKWRLRIFGELKHLQFCISIIIKREMHVLDSVVFRFFFLLSSLHSLAYSGRLFVY